MEGQGNPPNPRDALSLAAVPGAAALSLADVPGAAALSLADVPSAATALSLADVPSAAAALSLADVPGAAATVPRGSRDRLSRLPDHVLVRILLHLRTEEAAETVALSRRWRDVWAQLPVLNFNGGDSSVPASALAAYTAHGEDDIHSVTVLSNQMDGQHSSAWLSLAAPLLSGLLHFNNSRTLSQNTPELSLDDDALEVPCFKKATEIVMDLGYLGLALPPAGIFHALRVMWLEHFWFRGQLSIRDTMFPSLQELTITRAGRLVELTLNSNYLLYIHLSVLPEFQRLEILAPRLKELEVMDCFNDVQEPVASIAAESLEVLWWNVPCVPEFREIPDLRMLEAPAICTSWSEDICARFLKFIPAVMHLQLQISFGMWTDGSPLLLEDMIIPPVVVLSLYLETNGHVFEGRILQFLKRCPYIRELNLSFQDRGEMKAYCSDDCLCHSESVVWGAKVRKVRGLWKVNVLNFNGAPREVNLLEELVRRAPRLQILRVTSMVDDPCLEGVEEHCPAGCKIYVRWAASATMSQEFVEL